VRVVEDEQERLLERRRTECADNGLKELEADRLGLLDGVSSQSVPCAVLRSGRMRATVGPVEASASSSRWPA
jgi:hypothetical protein